MPNSGRIVGVFPSDTLDNIWNSQVLIPIQHSVPGACTGCEQIKRDSVHCHILVWHIRNQGRIPCKMIPHQPNHSRHAAGSIFLENQSAQLGDSMECDNRTARLGACDKFQTVTISYTSTLKKNSRDLPENLKDFTSSASCSLSWYVRLFHRALAAFSPLVSPQTLP